VERVALDGGALEAATAQVRTYSDAGRGHEGDQRAWRAGGQVWQPSWALWGSAQPSSSKSAGPEGRGKRRENLGMDRGVRSITSEATPPVLRLDGRALTASRFDEATIEIERQSIAGDVAGTTY